MTDEDWIEKSLAQIHTLPLKERDVLLTKGPLYYVVCTDPYNFFVRKKDGMDIFSATDVTEALERRDIMRVKHPLCTYDVYTLTKVVY